MATKPTAEQVIMDVQHANDILVEEGAAGDGFLARWPPHLLPDASGFFSTWQGRRTLSPLSSGIFASVSGSSHQLIDGLHTSVRQLLNQDRHDWVLISVFGVAVGSQEPQPTLVIVLRPGGASAARAKILVKQIVEVQQQ
jgi:hypothetical protein